MDTEGNVCTTTGQGADFCFKKEKKKNALLEAQQRMAFFSPAGMSLSDLQLENAGSNTLLIKRAEVTVVEVCVEFLKIGEINTMKEYFEATVLIRSKWREPDLDKEKLHCLKGPVDMSRIWKPKLFIENTIGDAFEHISYTVEYNASGQAYIIQKRRAKGNFLENLELNDYPFDVQDLTINVMSERTSSEVVFTDSKTDMHRVHKQSFVDEQEWKLYRFVESGKKYFEDESAGAKQYKPAFFVKCQAARRWVYFAYNIFLITFLISAMSFATFTVGLDDPVHFRLQLAFTLTLTTITFKFVIKNSLPPISYLTYADVYVLGTLIQLTLMVATHASLRMITDKDKVVVYDRIFCCILIGIFVCYNITFFLRIFLTIGRKRLSLQQKEEKYLGQFTKL